MASSSKARCSPQGGCQGVEFSLASLNKEAPYLFYLPNSEIVDLADATIAVAGSQLPVHSQYLAAASAVLCEVFKGQAEHREAKRVCPTVCRYLPPCCADAVWRTDCRERPYCRDAGTD